MKARGQGVCFCPLFRFILPLNFNPMSIVKSIKMPSKFVRLKKEFGSKAFTLLDAGSGNKSATDFKYYFPNGTYHGIDLVKDYNYAPEDFAKMDGFYQMDLTQLEYDKIPDNHFDAILVAHIIEHLHNFSFGLIRKLQWPTRNFLRYAAVSVRGLHKNTFWQGVISRQCWSLIHAVLIGQDIRVGKVIEQ